MTGPKERVTPGMEVFKVVVNHEEQYALWPINKDIPEKWRDTGIAGSKEDCLVYVRRVWTDMRPASVRTRDHSGGTASGEDEVR
jgi:MbtH protein